MFSLLKKEILSFFGSLTGYVVVIVFLLATGLFLWVFPGNYNILENGYATLDGLFSLAPFVYLFLVPAITMRLFSEEKRSGTLEVLLTRPLSAMQIVLAKFFAGLLLVTISLLPTFVYFYSVYVLGNPVGNIDVGGTWGAYSGLFFLAAIYVAIGLFASALTDNPVFAFVLALALSFVAYLGFDFVASMQLPASFQQIITGIGINEHYQSISRGVIDSRDLVYFLVAVFVLLFLTGRAVHFHKTNLKTELKKLAFVFVGLIFLAVLSNQFFFRIDLTAEKRYSLDSVSKELVAGLEEPINITLYLDGELPAGLRQLKKSVQEKITDYNAYSSKLINLSMSDPYAISDVKRRDRLFAELAEKGLQPVDVRQNTEQGTITRRIFPGAIINYGSNYLAINLLSNNQNLHAEVNLNNSIENLEYRLTGAFAQLIAEEKLSVAFLSGQGELSENELHDMLSALGEKYNVFAVTTNELALNGSRIKTLVVANPVDKFTEHEKFAIDQYLMNGGNIVWMIDPVQVSSDSLTNGYSTLAFPRDLNIDDLLFRYGIRLNTNLIQDAECMLIPVNVAPRGTPSRFVPAPWYYSPLLVPSANHVISRNLGRIKSEFVSSVDTVGKSDQVRRTVILSTSAHSLISWAPAEISLSSINNPPNKQLFNQPSQAVGVLLEGVFTSAFKNRVVDSFGVASSVIKTESKPVKMAVFADGGLMANQFSFANGKPEFLPLGYDRYSKQIFANKDLLLNTIDYLSNDSGLMALRSREFKIRLLDKVAVKEQKFNWQLLNVLSPILLVGALGAIFVFVRTRNNKR